MSLNKIFMLASSSQLSMNKSLIVTVKPKAGEGVSTIVFSAAHPYISFNVKVALLEMVAGGGYQYDTRTQAMVLAGKSTGVVQSEYGDMRAVTITLPSYWADKNVMLELVPVEGATDYDPNSGEPNYPMYFLCDQVEELYSFPTHPILSGVRFSSNRQIAKESSLTTIREPLPASYTELGWAFRNCRKLRTIPSQFVGYNGCVIKNWESAFENCGVLSVGSIQYNNTPAGYGASWRKTFKNCRALQWSFFTEMSELYGSNYSEMFSGASLLSQLPQNFLQTNTSSAATALVTCTDFSGMFQDAVVYQGTSTIFRPKNDAVIKFDDMFNGCAELVGTGLDIASWGHQTSTADRMFANCRRYTGKKSGGEPDSISLRIKGGTGERIFDNCKVFNGYCGQLFSNPASIGMNTTSKPMATFNNCTAFTGNGLEQNLVNIGGVTVESMFAGTTVFGDINLSGFKMGETIRNIQYMFLNSAWTGNGWHGWKFPVVLNAQFAFHGCANLGVQPTFGFPSFFSLVGGEENITASYMFANCTVLQPVFTNIYFRNVAMADYMFNNCKGITNQQMSGVIPSRLRSAKGMFYGCTNMTGSGLGAATFTWIENVLIEATEIFGACRNLLETPKLHFTAFDLNSPTALINLRDTYFDCTKLTMTDMNTKHKIDVAGARVHCMGMFRECISLTGPTDDPAYQNTIRWLADSLVNNASMMFYGCKEMVNTDCTYIVLAEYANRPVNVSSMFGDCVKFKGNGVGNMFQGSFARDRSTRFQTRDMAAYCVAFDSRFGSAIKLYGDCSNMFYGCYAFIGEGIAYWVMAEVTASAGMFRDCRSLKPFKSLMPSWKMPLVKNADNMFSGCTLYDGVGTQYIFERSSAVTSLSEFAPNCPAWKQSLRTWCVSKIPLLPSDFATNTPFLANAANQPVWGTCPAVP